MTKRYSDEPVKIITDDNLINFERTTEELQLFWLYCGFSVGKSRKHAQTALARLLDAGEGKTPCGRLRALIREGKLRDELYATRVGGWDRLEKFLRQSVDSGFNLRTVTVEKLEAVHGIGLTKARFFLLCSRETARCAVLDRHILTFIREQGHPDVPEQVGKSRKEYLRLEGYFLEEADKAGLSAARFNLKQWRARAQHD